MQLTKQYRMRPEIANTLMTYFYNNYTNDASTLGRDSIRGVQQDVVFVDHTQFEDYQKQLLSFSNAHEVAWVVAICAHLLRQVSQTICVTLTRWALMKN